MLGIGYVVSYVPNLHLDGWPLTITHVNGRRNTRRRIVKVSTINKVSMKPPISACCHRATVHDVLEITTANDTFDMSTQLFSVFSQLWVTSLEIRHEFWKALLGSHRLTQSAWNYSFAEWPLIDSDAAVHWFWCSSPLWYGLIKFSKTWFIENENPKLAKFLKNHPFAPLIGTAYTYPSLII